MKHKITELIPKFSHDLSDSEKYSIFREISEYQRAFKWNEWEFGIDLIDRPELIKHTSKENLLRMFVVIIETDKSNKSFFSQIIKSGIVDKIIDHLRKKLEQNQKDQNENIKIDATFDFRSDTTPNRDPDQHSSTLRLYHKLLWSKTLPNGQVLDLSDKVSGKYLYHKSNLGEFNLTSDSIIHSYKNTVRMKNVLDQIPRQDIQDIYNSFQTIGGYTVFPGGVRKGYQTINQARGCNQKVVDRFDITLECIRRYYNRVDSPLRRTFEGYSDFFNLFQNFRGYVDFFYLQDLVLPDYSKIKFFLPFDETFPMNPFPENVDNYFLYIKNTKSFSVKRTNRIIDNYQNDT